MKKWGKPFAVIALVFGIIALVFGVLSLIPLLGLVLAIITMVVAITAITFGIPGIIGSSGPVKTKAIVGLSFGAAMLVWAIARYFWAIAVLAAAASAA